MLKVDAAIVVVAEEDGETSGLAMNRYSSVPGEESKHKLREERERERERVVILKIE